MQDGWVKFNSSFRFPKTFDEKKARVCYQSFSENCGLQEQMGLQIFRGWQDQRTNKICTIEPGEVFKGEDIGLDVKELTKSIENENAKSLNYWLCKFVQEVANKSQGRFLWT